MVPLSGKPATVPILYTHEEQVPEHPSAPTKAPVRNGGPSASYGCVVEFMPPATNTKRTGWSICLLLVPFVIAIALFYEISSVHSRLMKMRARAAEPIRSVNLVQDVTGRHDLVGRRVLLSGVRVVRANGGGAIWIRTGEDSAPMLVRTAAAEEGEEIVPGARVIVEGTLRRLPTADQGRRSRWRLPRAPQPSIGELYVAAERLDRSDRLPSPVAPAVT